MILGDARRADIIHLLPQSMHFFCLLSTLKEYFQEASQRLACVTVNMSGANYYGSHNTISTRVLNIVC